MGEFTILLLVCFGIFVLVMPFFAIWNIWTLLQKIEKLNLIIVEKLTVIVSRDVKKDM
jgi:hypothetical protein